MSGSFSCINVDHFIFRSERKNLHCKCLFWYKKYGRKVQERTGYNFPKKTAKFVTGSHYERYIYCPSYNWDPIFDLGNNSTPFNHLKGYKFASIIPINIPQ